MTANWRLPSLAAGQELCWWQMSRMCSGATDCAAPDLIDARASQRRGHEGRGVARGGDGAGVEDLAVGHHVGAQEHALNLPSAQLVACTVQTARDAAAFSVTLAGGNSSS